MVKIGLKYKDEGEYIGRPSPLGNPFYMKDESMRDIVCDKYEDWFADMVNKAEPKFMEELNRLVLLHKTNGMLTLLCYCAPKRCHGETIKRYIESK